MHNNKLISSLLILISYMLFMSCESKQSQIAQAVSESENNFQFTITGALTTDFTNIQRRFQNQAIVRQLDGQYWLIATFSVIAADNALEESATLSLQMPIKFDGNHPAIGQYLLDTDLYKMKSNTLKYMRRKNALNFEKLQFEGRRASVHLTEVGSDSISGKVSLQLIQCEGERNSQGLSEEVLLVNEGKINAFIEFHMPFTNDDRS